VTGLAGDGQRLLVVLDRPPGLAQIGVAAAEAAQPEAFAAAVTGLAGDGQRLLVVLDRPAGLSQVGIAVSQAAQRTAFDTAVAGLAGVLLTRGHPTVVYPETLLTFRIDTPVTVSTMRAPQAFRYVDPYEYDRPVQTQVSHERRPAPYYNGAPPYYYGGYNGGWYGPGYGYGYPYWGWGGGFGGGLVIGLGHGGFRRFR